MNENQCVWTNVDSDLGEFFYDTSCKEFGVNKEDDYKFCPYCGAPLRVSAGEKP